MEMANKHAVWIPCILCKAKKPSAHQLASTILIVTKTTMKTKQMMLLTDVCIVTILFFSHL